MVWLTPQTRKSPKGEDAGQTRRAVFDLAVGLGSGAMAMSPSFMVQIRGGIFRFVVGRRPALTGRPKTATRRCVHLPVVAHNQQTRIPDPIGMAHRIGPSRRQNEPFNATVFHRRLI